MSSGFFAGPGLTSEAVSLTSDEPVVLVMTADSEPDDSINDINAKRAKVKPDPD